jgi:hypothetical protein
MAIDRFSKLRFEEALPTNKHTGEPIWKYIGFEKGEHVYAVPVKMGVEIHIRSSIGEDFYAASTGQDSIRFHLYKDGKPFGSKISCYVTRVRGWENRMLDQLRILWKRATSTELCEYCNGPKAVFKSRNTGKLFQACPDHFSSTMSGYEEVI